MGGNCEVNEALGEGNPWYTGRAGWIVSGIFVLFTIIVASINVARHARNYRAPKEQRQIIRIIYTPIVYGVINWLAYRFIHYYVYLSLIYVVYEAIAVCAFLYLMIEYVSNAGAATPNGSVLRNKEKRRVPVPWCCFRYRPTKSSFIHMVKWLVFQFIIIKPAVSIITIILHAVDALCSTQKRAKDPAVWLGIIDFLSMVTAVDGLLIFYGLTKEEIKEHRPLLKFLIIKGMIFLTILQELVLKILHTSGIIKSTESWTSTEVTDAFYVIILSIEMALFSLVMLRAFSSAEYANSEKPRGTAVQAIIDSINFGDFITDMWHSLAFFWGRQQAEPHKETHEPLVSAAYYDKPRVRRPSASWTPASRMDTESSPKNETRVVVEPV